jgi:M6 family metalloprotease-like protein
LIGGSTAVWGVQQWRILALRVDFPLEAPDALSTTGTGSFDLRNFDQAQDDYQLPYDIPPHDRTYFENHLQALASYYRTVSDGEIEIDFAVFPQEANLAYTLPQSALLYGNGRTTEEIEDNWVQLFEDAVRLAEADPQGPSFDQFNSFLIFHAGVGHETGQLNDVRSVYLSAQDIARIRPEALTVDGGAFKISDFWILPEAVSLRGVAGLNGVLAKFFGHQLGLPGLSNFADGLPGIGGWSLMDVGSNRLGFVLREQVLEAAFGFVPPHPIAWSKARLGWLEPLVVERDTTISLLATDRPGDLPKAVRIPITDSEYFLLENRQSRALKLVPEGVEPPFINESEATWIDPAEVVFSNNNESGVWLEVEEYDAFLPGSGVLIWHVDDGVINDNLEAGAINNDSAHQGIVLEEADGYRDIGSPFFDRIANIEGSVEDPFFVGGQTLFATDTQPDSRTNTGLSSGIEIEVLSVPGDTMEVRIRFKRTQAAWPQSVLGGRVLQAADVDGNGAMELIVETATGVSIGVAEQGLAAWRVEGARFLAAGDVDDDARAEIFVVRGNDVSAWRMDEAQPLWEQAVDEAPTVALLAGDLAFASQRPLLVLGGEALVIFDALTGELLRSETLSATGMTLADTDGDGQVELVFSGVAGGWRLGDELESLWAAGRFTGGVLASADLDGNRTSEILGVDVEGVGIWDAAGARSLGRFDVAALAVGSGPVIGDIDGDGQLEIITGVGDALYILRANGLDQENFPFRLPRFAAAGALDIAPILADLDADGRQEIVMGARNGVYAVDASGEIVDGFPLLTASPVVYSPVAADLDGDGRLEWAALSQDAVYIWDPEALATTYTGTQAAWGQAGLSAAHTFAQVRPDGAQVPSAVSSLLPASRAYCHPNPVGPAGTAHMRFFVARPAQVDLKVFDALGERYEHIKLSADQIDPTQNELVWSTRDYPTGLYLCRLEARTEDGQQAVVIVKMAVSQ